METALLEFAWHVHHDVLVELLVEPIKYRQQDIRQNKPEEERERRLALLKPVLGILPDSVIKAGAAYAQAVDAYAKAWATRGSIAAFGKAGDVYDKAEADFKEVCQTEYLAIEALHKLECPNCTWDGKTIFPESKEEGNATS